MLLPEGFEIEQSAQPTTLPEGFEIESPVQAQPLPEGFELESAPEVMPRAGLTREETLQYGQPISTITGKPMPTTEEKFGVLPKAAERVGGLAKTAGRGLVHGALGLAETVGTAAQYAGERFGRETIADIGKTTSEYWERKAKPFGPPEEIAGKNVIDNPELLADASWWVYNVSGMIPTLAATIIPTIGATKGIQVAGKALSLTPKLIARLAQIGRYATAGVVGGGLEGAQTYKQVLQEGGSEEEAARAGELMTLGAGALNALGISKILAKAGPGFKGRVIKTLGAGIWEGLTEAGEEPTEVFSKYIGKFLAGEELPANLTEQLLASLKDAATVAPIAAVTGGGAAMISGRGVAPKPQVEITPEPTVEEVAAEPIQEVSQPEVVETLLPPKQAPVAEPEIVSPKFKEALPTKKEKEIYEERVETEGTETAINSVMNDRFRNSELKIAGHLKKGNVEKAQQEYDDVMAEVEKLKTADGVVVDKAADRARREFEGSKAVKELMAKPEATGAEIAKELGVEYKGPMVGVKGDTKGYIFQADEKVGSFMPEELTLEAAREKLDAAKARHGVKEEVAPVAEKAKEPWEMGKKEFEKIERTNESITTADISPIFYRSSSIKGDLGMNLRGNGIFLGNDIGMIKNFAQMGKPATIYAAKIKIKKPYYMDWLEIENYGSRGLAKLIPELQEKGYDAIVEKNTDLPSDEQQAPWQVAVFDKSQIEEIGKVKNKEGRFGAPDKLSKDIQISIIQQALKEGKPVPKEVLAEYPELKPKAAPAKEVAPKVRETAVAPEEKPTKELSDEELKAEITKFEQMAAPYYKQLEKMPEEGKYIGKYAKYTPAAQEIDDKIKPLQQRVDSLKYEVQKRKDEAIYEETRVAINKAIKEADVFQRRNGWEIIKVDFDYYLREPNTKEEVYKSQKLKRIREVADESPPDEVEEAKVETDEKPTPGRAWINNQWRPITSAKEITRKGKKQGKIEVTLPNGKKKLLEKGDIKVWPGEKVEAKVPRITETIKGEKVEEIFVRKPTKAEKVGGTPRSRGFNKVPDKEGWEKVYKPYGEDGEGYYYQKKTEAPVEEGIDSPEFKKWFGDSKVVDEKGKPLVVYHGTGQKEATFKGHSYWTPDPKYAGSFSYQAPLQDKWKSIYPAYIKLENALDLTQIGVREVSADYLKQVIKNATGAKNIPNGLDIDLDYDAPPWMHLTNANKEVLGRWLKKHGFDGVYLTEQRTARSGNPPVDSYVVFNPSQIKSTLSMKAKSRLKAKLKDQKGAFSLKSTEGPAILEDLVTVGKDVISQGHDTYSKFAKQMKATLSDVWDSIRRFMMKVYSLAKKALRSERGAIGGERAVGAPVSKIAEAEKMLAAGKSKEEVWEKTGWLRGAEGKWKFEIDDSNANLKDLGLGKQTHKLGDVLEHRELYNAYPVLKALPVHSNLDKKKSWTGGSYFRPDGIEGEILSNGRITIEGNPDKAKKYILHEIQHVIQRIEGFAVGGSETAIYKTIKAQSDKLMLKHQKDQESFHQKMLLAKDKKTKNKLKAKRDESEALAIKAWEAGIEDPYYMYRRIAGEIEARDVAARVKLTPAQRKAQFPYEARGIPQEDWIITKGEGTSFSVKPTEKPVAKPEAKKPSLAVQKVLAAAKKAEKAKLPKKAFKGIIRGKTGQIKISDILSVKERDALRDQIRAEARAARVAFAAGKKEAALKHKEKYQMLVAKAKERKRIRTRVTKIITGLKKVKTDKMSPHQAKAVTDLIQDFDLIKLTSKKRLRLTKTKEYFENNYEAELPERVLSDLQRLDKKPIRDLTLDGLESIHTAILHHVHLDKVKHTIRVGREARRADQVLTDSISEMKPPKKVKTNIVASQQGKLGKLKNTGTLIVDTFGIRHDHYDLIVESLSGQNSTMDKVLYQGVKEGITEELKYKQDTFKKFQEDLGDFSKKHKVKDITKWMNETETTGKFKLTRGERMSLYRHSLNADNKRSIIEGGFGFKYSKMPNKVHKITENELTDILGSLTAAEKEFAGKPVENLFAEQIEALDRVFLQKNGYPIPRELNYYPKEIMPLSRGVDVEVESAFEQFKGKWLRIGVSKGMLKKRLRVKLPIYLNSIAYDINRSVMRSSAYVGLEIPLSNASKLLYDPAFRLNLSNRYGEQTWREIEKGLRDIAGEYQTYTTTEKLLLKAKNNIATAMLGLNPFVMAKQVLSLPVYLPYVKSNYLALGVIDMIWKPKKIVTRHKLYSPEYLERVEGGFSRDVADVFKTGAEKRIYAGKKSIQEKFMGGIKLFDKMAVNPGMHGAVLQVLSEFKQGKLSREVGIALDIKDAEIASLTPEQKMQQAYKYADYATQRTQPMFSPEHRSSLSRGSTTETLFTMFGSFINQALNLTRRNFRDAMRTGDSKAWSKFAKSLLVIFVINTLGVMAIDEIRDRLYGRKKKAFWGRVLSSWSGYMFFVRDLASSVVSKIERGTFLGYDVSLPISRIPELLSNSIADGVTALTEKDKPKKQKAVRRFVDEALELSLMLKGIPYATPKKLVLRAVEEKPETRGRTVQRRKRTAPKRSVTRRTRETGR